MAGAPESFDVVVVGAGIAGASLAWALAAGSDGAPPRRVLLLEQEAQPGYHTTGRSAALYTETYGNAVMRALTRASRPFFAAPPAGFSPVPLWHPRGTLLVATAAQRGALQAHFDDCRALCPGLRLLDEAAARGVAPGLAALFAPRQVDGALWDPDAMDLDVDALHQGCLRGLRAAGGQLRCNAAVEQGECLPAGGWRLRLRGGALVDAAIVVNAAGAWADTLAARCGVAPLGIQPLRRTVVTLDGPDGVDAAALARWPAVIDVDEQWYLKPEAGRLLASPADETPSPPCDAQPDEWDVAVLVDRLQNATALPVRRLHARWAGLRSFAPDRTLVAGPDPAVPGFVWCAGQGGYGIQTAPAAARAAAALLHGRPLPEDLLALGLDAAALGPSRLRTPAGRPA